MEPATACLTDPSPLLANDCASFIIACTISKDDLANRRNKDPANRNPPITKAGEATSTSRKTNQLANNNQAKLNGQEEGRQEAVTDYIKFHYLGEAKKNAMNNDLYDTTEHKFPEIKSLNISKHSHQFKSY